MLRLLEGSFALEIEVPPETVSKPPTRNTGASELHD